MESILRDIIANGGFPLKVGGCVRDKLLGLSPKDIDIEVYNLSVEKPSKTRRKWDIARKTGGKTTFNLYRGSKHLFHV